MADRRILLVHAHPDDETIGNGTTMAKYVAEGAQVTLVTCTRGEEGEVLVPDLVHLAADQEDGLGEHREKEMADAMAALGVSDQRWLGGAGRYRDSGMIGTPANDRPNCFWRADLKEAADHLVAVIREQRPQVLVTYDDFGGYGHPDHIQAHRVATYAHALAGVPSYRRDLGDAWDIPKVYWTAMPETNFREGLRRLRDAGDTTFEGLDPDGELPPSFVPDELIDARIDGGVHVEQKMAAMRAHATQISVDGPFFALSNNLGNQVWAEECYRLIRGTPGERDPQTGVETDLFSGVA
ncbi:N-acetyl-1-D-myo-inositol-2-amino-2-deoxy-alpha-D-glucopyranoside deacetylase [Actinopolymorpha alba]|uniref:N-acetyl-1-D-myo-inositol-2-amino-2-deoxy-alpha- D-glucopyranoside deacetylase n=1 Tax=Actinopolymorpha alba TaxID=533267 RepID=UPI0003A1AA97|nr:N-acetyl-1-D-myo-inositol-2-amino-2-deoxy-alpha-D-glucopyranoside deacetylase [Actinopolymorpha alba]